MSEREKIIDFVQQKLSGSNQGAHSFEHTMRVFSIARELAEDCSVSKEVLEAAALLHDVGRPDEDVTGVSHSISSGEMSKPLLKELGYTEDEIERIVNAIRTHRFSEGLEPDTMEGMILSDADKLDAIGAIGVYRAIAQAEATGKGMEGFLNHADEKLLKLKDLMHTDSGKRLALERHATLQRFVDDLRAEISDDRL
jgi:uncharacterized protein